jgi:hypothetical protein
LIASMVPPQPSARAALAWLAGSVFHPTALHHHLITSTTPAPAPSNQLQGRVVTSKATIIMTTKTNVIQFKTLQTPIDSTPEAPQVIMVRPKSITRLPELTFRNGRPDRLHVTALLQALRTRGELTPITLWRGLDGTQSLEF